MCNLSWTPHSNLEKDNSLNNSCVSPKMGCLEYTNSTPQKLIIIYSQKEFILTLRSHACINVLLMHDITAVNYHCSI